MASPQGYIPRFSEDVYRELITYAKTAHPHPLQSNFYVRTAAMTLSGKFVVGGNNEFGITDATHGEDSVIDAALQNHPGDPLVLVGFYNVGAGHCGNCRDRLKEVFAAGAETISASSENLEDLLVLPFHATFLREEFPLSQELNADEVVALNEASWGLKMSYDIHVREEDKKKIYGAALITKAGIFPGGFEGCVAYDPGLALRVAENVLMYASKDKDRFKIESALIVGYSPAEHQPPHVLYKDRQQFTEFIERMGHIGGKIPLPIKLVAIRPDGGINAVWQTNTHEWLPLPFMPSELGADENVKAHSRRILGI